MYQLAKSHDYGINTCQQCLEKQREIDRLTEENQRLRAKLARQKRKDQEGFFGSSTPSAQIPVKANSTAENNQKRGGAKPGHTGHGRTEHAAEEVDCIRTVSVDPFCPSCHAELVAKDVRQRSVLDIDPITVKRVLYRLERKECPCCGVVLQATAPGVLSKTLLSNQLLTEIVDSHYVQGMPLGRVCARWQLNYGTVIQALHRLGGICAPVMEELKRDYREAFVRHADETTWRTDGHSGYCWLFASERVSLHLYRNTRSRRVVEEVLGTEPLAGYLVVDRYVGYKRVPCRVQYCYAHLLREMKDLQAAFADEKEVAAYAERMIALLAEAMRLQSSRPADEEYYREAQRIRREIAQACTEPSPHLAIKRWQDFFVDEADHLYQWVEDRRVPCENNRAERELRPTVIARKVSHGSQAEEGAKTREVLMSVMQTLKKRVADPRQRFKAALDELAVNVKCKVSELLFHVDDG
jgi:transposase